MQRHKALFADPDHVGTIANVQSCLRLNDLDAIGDGTHRLAFRMLGLFSFREMTLGEAIDLWVGFLDDVGLPPHHVTIHPDRIDAWTPLYRGRFPVVPDPECRWSDGAISGYCTEFYRDGVEIGNVVTPLGTCIDAGFGLDRLAALIDGGPTQTRVEALREAVETIAGSGFSPGPKGQGSVLRRLLRLLAAEGVDDVPFGPSETLRRARSRERYARLAPRNLGRDAAWWLDTHGVDLGET